MFKWYDYNLIESVSLKLFFYELYLKLSKIKTTVTALADVIRSPIISSLTTMRLRIGARNDGKKNDVFRAGVEPAMTEKAGHVNATGAKLTILFNIISIMGQMFVFLLRLRITPLYRREFIRLQALTTLKMLCDLLG